jgi:hypothetical protein
MLVVGGGRPQAAGASRQPGKPGRIHPGSSYYGTYLIIVVPTIPKKKRSSVVRASRCRGMVGFVDGQ